MNIRPIQNYYFSPVLNKTFDKKLPKDVSLQESKALYPQMESLPSAYYYPLNISFGIANSAKLKTLFSYGLPCMYTGVEMIDPKKVQRLLKINAFDGPISEVMKKLKPFEKSLQGIELYVYRILGDQSKIFPNKTLAQTMKDISPIYNKKLQEKQNPIFLRLIFESRHLPEEYRYKFMQFMAETRDKIDHKPVEVPFSAMEFLYKLDKIKADVYKNKSSKAIKVINKLVNEAGKLEYETNESTLEHQKQVIGFMRKIVKSSVLKEKQQLHSLLDNADGRLNHKKILMPFNRKSFIYDLDVLLENLPDEELKIKMHNIAERLPTSREYTSAYIMKYRNESSEKIAYRLLWPFMASVEHIHPHSCGGADVMSNFGGATTRSNSDRQSIPFVEQIKNNPNIKLYCQRYVDRLIELANNGVFASNHIDVKYIKDFKRAIFTESNREIILDISKLAVTN